MCASICPTDVCGYSSPPPTLYVLYECITCGVCAIDSVGDDLVCGSVVD